MSKILIVDDNEPSRDLLRAILKSVPSELEDVGGNKVQAAKILGINRATVYRILNEPDPGEERAEPQKAQ